jgi:cell division protease FtsH
MPKHTSLPGYQLAQKIMAETARDVDALFDDVLDGCDLDDPETGARPKRPSPDTCLDALLILRLMSGHAAAGCPSMLPQPGAATLILAPNFDDVKRLRPLIEKLNVELMSSGRPRPQHLLNLDIITQPRAGASTYDMRRFNENIRDAALRGHPVMVIATAARALDPDIRDIASATLQLSPATRAMLDAILKLLFPGSRTSNPQLDLRGISEMQFARVFAADTASGARKALRALTPATVSGGAAPAITLEDVHGQPKVKVAFTQLCADLEEWKAGDLPWGEVTSSFLLKGPPGTGKTMLAEALAGSTGLTLVKTSYSECQRGGHQGDMLRELNTACERAISAAPAILFIDEMDSFQMRGGSGNFSGYITGVVNGLLVEIDRVNATPGVVLLAASNFADRIDPAITRPGRLDQHLEVGPLDRTGVRSLICATIPDTLSPEEAEMLADQLSGQTGARVAALLRDARTRARRERRPLSAEHVFEAAEAVAPVPDPAHLHRVAIHEAGHLLMGHLCGLKTPKRAALRGHGGEIVRDAPDLLTPSLATAMIRVSLAGRVAEAMFFDEISSGSGGPGQGSDLASATRMALQIELSYGFSSRLSWHDPGCTLSLQPQEIRTAVETRLREAEAVAGAALTPHRDTLERIASVLIAERDLDQARLSGLLEGISPHGEATHSDEAVPRAG